MWKLWLDGILLMGKLTAAVVGVALGLGLADLLDGDEEVYELIDELVADNDGLFNRVEELEEDLEDVCIESEIRCFR